LPPKIFSAAFCTGQKRPKLVALDTMNYWIETHTATNLKDNPQRTVDILVIKRFRNTATLQRAQSSARSKAHLQNGPVSTGGKNAAKYGAMLVDKNGVFCVPAFPLERTARPHGSRRRLRRRLHGLPSRAPDQKTDAALRRAMVYAP